MKQFDVTEARVDPEEIVPLTIKNCKLYAENVKFCAYFTHNFVHFFVIH